MKGKVFVTSVGACFRGGGSRALTPTLFRTFIELYVVVGGSVICIHGHSITGAVGLKIIKIVMIFEWRGISAK